MAIKGRKRDPGGDRTVLHPDCGDGHMNLHIWYNHTEHTNTLANRVHVKLVSCEYGWNTIDADCPAIGCPVLIHEVTTGGKWVQSIWNIYHFLQLHMNP